MMSVLELSRTAPSDARRQWHRWLLFVLFVAGCLVLLSYVLLRR